MSELYIKVKPDGNVEIEAVGYTGTTCLSASMPYEKALGIVSSRKKKPEMLSEGVRQNVTPRNRIKN